MVLTVASASAVLKQNGGVEPEMVAIKGGGAFNVIISALVHPLRSVTTTV